MQRLGAPPGRLGAREPLPPWGVPASPPRGFPAARDAHPAGGGAEAVETAAPDTDGIATDADIVAFYSKLPSADKAMVKISGLAHTALLGVNRARFWHVLHSFLAMPARVDLQGEQRSGAGHA